MNTGIPGLDPLRDYTEKPATEQVLVVQEQRYYAAQWLRLCRKIWRHGKTLACEVHTRDYISLVVPRRMSLVARESFRAVGVGAFVLALVWYYTEGQYRDLSFLWIVPLGAIAASALMAWFIETHKNA